MIKRYFLILFLLMSAVMVWADENNPLELNDEINIDSFVKEISFSTNSIVGPDDRQEITKDNAEGLEKAVVSVLTYISRSPKSDFVSYCSGAMIAPNVVLTAAHCLVNDKGEYRLDAEVFAHAAKNPPENGGPKVPVSAKSVKLKASEKYIEHKKNDPHFFNIQDHDYGIIVLDKPIGSITGWFDVKKTPMSQLISAKIKIMGYAVDKSLKTLCKSEGSIFTKHSPGSFEHDADLISGASGGPIVLKDNPNEIVGVIVSQLGTEDYVEDGHPNLGLAINQDILDFIQEELEDIAKPMT